jgi:hypothetical protein
VDGVLADSIGGPGTGESRMGLGDGEQATASLRGRRPLGALGTGARHGLVARLAALPSLVAGAPLLRPPAGSRMGAGTGTSASTLPEGRDGFAACRPRAPGRGGPRIWGLGIQNFSKCNFFWQPKVQIVAHS